MAHRCAGPHVVALILLLLGFGFGIVALAGDWLVTPTGPNNDYDLTDAPKDYYGGDCLQFRLLYLCNNCVPVKTQGSCTTYRNMNRAAIAAGEPTGMDTDDDDDDDDDNDNEHGFHGPYRRHLAAGATAFALIVTAELIGLVAAVHAVMLTFERPYSWLAGRHHRATYMPTLLHTLFTFAGWLIWTCVIFTSDDWRNKLTNNGTKVTWGYGCAIVSFMLSLISGIIIAKCHRDLVVVTTTATTNVAPHEQLYGGNKKGVVMEERRGSLAA